jgi:hypothetical protein
MDTDTIMHTGKITKTRVGCACLPCRKAKARCDHEIPCSRCKRKGIQDQCVKMAIEEQEKLENSANFEWNSTMFIVEEDEEGEEEGSLFTAEIQACRNFDRVLTNEYVQCIMDDQVFDIAKSEYAQCNIDDQGFESDHSLILPGMLSYNSSMGEGIFSIMKERDFALDSSFRSLCSLVKEEFVELNRASRMDNQLEHSDYLQFVIVGDNLLNRTSKMDNQHEYLDYLQLVSVGDYLEF